MPAGQAPAGHAPAKPATDTSDPAGLGDAERRDGTVGKALAVLDQVAAFGRPVRLFELLAASPYPKATLFRILRTLTSQGMLSYDEERQTYHLGLRLVRLAHTAWRDASLAPIARPHLDALSADLGETVHLAQLDAGQVLYVDKRNAARPIEMFSEAGKVGPAYCTGVGKAMLAYQDAETLERLIPYQAFQRFTPHTLTDAAALRAELAAICARGHAFDNEEHEPGIICVAVPVRARDGRVLGALSVTGSTARLSLTALAAHAPRLNGAAARIAEDAEGWRFPTTPRTTKSMGA
ncbi:MAG: IclR family transcriptional regulator [Pseudomonadota bacterium]